MDNKIAIIAIATLVTLGIFVAIDPLAHITYYLVNR